MIVTEDQSAPEGDQPEGTPESDEAGEGTDSAEGEAQAESNDE